MNASCGLTLLRTVDGRKKGEIVRHRATKTFHWNTTLGEWLKRGYSAGALFTAQERTVGSLAELAAVIEAVRNDPCTFIVRGALAPAMRAAIAANPDHRIRRQKNPAPGREPSLVETLRRWIPIDIDDFPLRDTDDLADDPELVIERAIHELLPPCFHDATCWWQLSSSAGFAQGVLKVHLFFWLTEPADDRTVRAVIAQHAPDIDRAPFNAAQPLYVADPIIIGGHDPLPRRTGWRHGLDDAVELPALDPVIRARVTAEPCSSGTPQAPIELVAEALSFIPNDDLQWDDWNTIALAMFAASGGSEAGFGAWSAWSAKSRKHDTDACRERWEHFHISPPTSIGAGSIFYRAGRHGWHQRRRPHTAATSTLAAFYPAPTEDRDTAKARQDAAMWEHLDEASHIAEARRDLRRRRAEAIEEAGGEDALTPGQKATITKDLHREIARREGFGTRIPLPPQHMFTGAQGTGKTTVARQYAAAGEWPGITTWITEPTFEKSLEEYLAYRREAGADSPPAMQIRGRERPDPKRPGHLMCDRPVAARHIAEAGLSVPDLLCRKCEFRDKCGDHRQRQEAEALAQGDNGVVFFLAGNYVFLAAPAPSPDHAILDESLLRLAIEVRFVPIAELAALSVPNIDYGSLSTHVTLRAIVEAFTVAHPTTPARVAAGDDRIMPRPLAYLRHAGIDGKALRHLAKATRAELERQTPDIDASMNDFAIEAALDGGNRSQLRQLLGLISALQTEIDLPRETTTGVWQTTVSGAPALGVARLQSLRGLKHAAITVLDGTGKQSLARKLFGDRLAETRIPFERQAHVIGTRGKSYSKQSITAEDSAGNTISTKVASAAKLRGEIATIYDRLPAGSAICATKRVEEILLDTGAVHRDTPTMHFGALRGLNQWESCPGEMLIGAENVSICDVEAMARAFLAADPAPFLSMDAPPPKGWRWEHQWPYRATRMRRMRDGSTSPVEVPVHPDPRVQEALELIREDELMQAFDRPRSVWHRRQFVLLNDLCLDVTYDAIYSHRHLVAGGNPIERAFLATGIVPLSPEDLHHAHPTIFRTPKAAEHARKNYPQNPNRNPIWDCGVVFYRRLGQRGPEARALLDRGRYPDQAAAIVAFEAVIGCKLQAYEGVALRRDGEPPVVGPTKQPEPWMAPAPRQRGSGAAPPSIMMHGPPEG
jgi:hypothetical protein